MRASKAMRWLGLALALGVLLNSSLGGVSVAQAPAELKLPEGAVKLTDVFPAMGEHWAIPKDLPLGPIYMVFQGKVIGVEYMWNPPMMKQVPAPPPEVVYQLGPLSLFGQKINHYSIDYIWPGHPGFEQGHYDTHFYFITPEERFKIGPPQAAPAAATVGVATTLPKEAISLSPVVPAMGEHWANPAQLPFGPIYLVHKGKVVGWEHMWKHTNLSGGKVTIPGEGEFWIYGIPVIPIGQVLDHMTIEYLPKGHAGYEEWHYDVHLYNITSKDREAIK